MASVLRLGDHPSHLGELGWAVYQVECDLGLQAGGGER